MRDCAHIAGSLHMTIHMEVLIENLKALGSDLRWWSGNILSTHDHTVAEIVHGESDSVFTWKGGGLDECWECTLNDLIWTEDSGKGHIPDLIVDDGVNMTLLIHDGNNAEDLFPKYGTLPDPRSTDNAEFNILKNIIKHQLEGGEMDKWKNISNTCMRVSDKTSAGVHYMNTM